MTNRKTFADLTIDERRSYRSARLLYVPATLLSLVFWVFGLTVVSSFVAKPIDNPAGLIFWLMGLMILCLPYIALAVHVIFARTMTRIGYNFKLAKRHFSYGFVVCVSLSLVWHLVIWQSEMVWQYTGLFCFLSTVFLAPAYLGGIVASRHFESKEMA